MFEEVPRERRRVARLLPVRRVVLGPFVLGGGMVLAALGGSVAVAAAAATMITASAIRSDDVPLRPGNVASSPSSTQQALAAKRPPAHHRTATPSTAGHSAVAHPSGGPAAPSVPHLATVPGSPGVALPAPERTVTTDPSARNTGPAAAPSSPADRPSGTPAPSSSAPPGNAPLGNAVIHVSGYDQASERLAYQFASVRSGAGIDGGDLYQVLAPDTFTAALAPSITITSGGGICPPAGSACTADQLIRAADSGFFAVVAIDSAGELRSVIEVGDQSATPKLTPAPSTVAAADSSRRMHPRRTSPLPSSSPSATS
jgi:hypothetical protein